MGFAILKTLRHHKFLGCTDYSSSDDDLIISYKIAFVYARSKAVQRPSDYFNIITFLLPEFIQYYYYKQIFDHVVSLGDINMFRPLIINCKQFVLDHFQSGDESSEIISTLLDSRNKCNCDIENLQHPQLLRIAF